MVNIIHYQQIFIKYIKNNLLDFVVFLFIFNATLYYFLRFQFDINYVIIGIHLTLLVLLVFLGIYYLKRNVNNLSIKMMMFLLYGVYLLSITFYNGGTNALLYSLKDYIFVFLLFLFYYEYVKKDNYILLFYFVGIVGTIISSIYCLEVINFYNSTQTYNDVFDYTKNLRVAAAGSIGENIVTFTSSGSRFYRMAGVLAHNNVTALVIGITVLSLIALNLSVKRLYLYPFIIFNFFTLILTGARTAIIAFLIGCLYLYWNKIKNVIFILFSIPVSIYVIMYYFPGSGYIFNIDQFFNTFTKSVEDIQLIGIDRLYNIILGSGFNFPNMETYINSSNDYLFPIVSDHFFIIQLCTIFGVLPLLYLFYGIFLNKEVCQNAKYKNYIRIVQSIILVFFVSTLHTNALVRPQALHILILFLALLYKLRFLSSKSNS